MESFKDTRRSRLGAALTLALLGAAGTVSADLSYGTLSNFDVYNDTGTTTYGFEIEFDDISSGSLSFTFPNPHYGSGVKLQTGATAVLRYAATFNGSSWSASTALHPTGGQVATSGHACVFAQGCEHFGVGLFAQPTAVRYNWLVEDSNSPGTLIKGPAVSLMAPIWSFSPPANAGEAPIVNVRMEAPEFEQENEVEKQYPDAVWAKIIKIELDEELELGDLMSDNDLLFDLFNADEGDLPGSVEREIEWDLVEKGRNALEAEDRPADDRKQIIRRIETYRYIGPVTLENEPDCDLIDCQVPIPGDTLGDLIGANIAAANLVPVEVAPVPLPAAVLLMAPALGLLGAVARRRG